jgi:hypothetical protein
VPPAYIAPASALDQPALGLVLAFAALLAIPQGASLLAQVLLLDLGDVKMIALGGLLLATALFQLAAGVAIAWQWRLRAPLFFACVGCGVALVLAVYTLWRDELPWRPATVMMVETIGGPLLVAVAPRLFGLQRIARGHALGGLLIVSAVSVFVFEPAYLLHRARVFGEAEISVGGWLGEGLHVAAVVATAVLQLLVGLRLARGQRARGYLTAYVITALVGLGGLQVLAVVYWLVDRDEPHMKFVFANMLIELAIAIVRPLIVWQFAKLEGEPGPRVDAALPWVALWFVPQLAARCLLGEEVDVWLGSLAWSLVALCALQSIACLVAARASLRGEHAVTAWRFAAGIAALLFAFVAYWVFSPNDYGDDAWHKTRVFNLVQSIWPVALLFATMATGAWLANRGRSTP